MLPCDIVVGFGKSIALIRTMYETRQMSDAKYVNIKERVKKLVSDRVQSEKFPLTQEFIAQMLGCRRSGVTVAAGALSHAGMISYKRGNINILNRQDLEATSCECYSIIKNEYARLLDIRS